MTEKDTTMEQIGEHLEFMGYDLETVKGVLFAKHEDEPNFIIGKSSSSEVNITTFYSFTNSTKKKINELVLKAVNEFNRISDFASFYCELDPNTKNVQLIMKSSYEGNYDKKTFGSFFNKLKNDYLRAMSSEYINVFIDH